MAKQLSETRKSELEQLLARRPSMVVGVKRFGAAQKLRGFWQIAAGGPERPLTQAEAKHLMLLGATTE